MDERVEWENTILDLMHDCPVFMLLMFTRISSVPSLCGLPHRFLAKDILVGDWNDNFYTYPVVVQMALEYEMSRWLNNLPFYDIIFHPWIVHTLFKLLSINPYDVYFNSSYVISDSDKMELKECIMSKCGYLPIPFRDDIVDNMATFFKDKYCRNPNHQPVLWYYTRKIEPSKDDMIHGLMNLSEDVFDQSVFVGDYMSDAPTDDVIMMCTHTIMNYMLNHYINTVLTTKLSGRDSTDLLQSVHMIYQVTRLTPSDDTFPEFCMLYKI